MSKVGNIPWNKGLKYTTKQKKNEAVLRKKCRQKTNNAIRDKKIRRLPCEKCGDIKSQAHHENYKEPFNIYWLCEKHHRELHKE